MKKITVIVVILSVLVAVYFGRSEKSPETLPVTIAVSSLELETDSEEEKITRKILELEKELGSENEILMLDVDEQLIESIDSNNAADLEAVAELFHYGHGGMERNLKKALLWYLKAAEQGSAEAMDVIALFYAAGSAGLEKSCADSIFWFEEAIKYGYEYSKNNVAWTYATCANYEFRNAEKAVEYAEDIVFKQGDIRASTLDTLAAAYAENDDFENAIKYQEAALGLLLEKGEHDDEIVQRYEMYQRYEKWRGESIVLLFSYNY